MAAPVPHPPPAAGSLDDVLASVAERGLAEYVAKLDWADPLMDEARRTYDALAALGRAHPADEAVRASWNCSVRELLLFIGSDPASMAFKPLLEAELATFAAAAP